MKFITDIGDVGALKGDISEAERCHGATLHNSKEQLLRPVKPDMVAKIHLVDLEPPGRKIPERPQLEGELDRVQIGPEAEQVTMMAKNLSDEQAGSVELAAHEPRKGHRSKEAGTELAGSRIHRGSEIPHIA
ncbi:hypothetical protein PIB30_095987 [Stylosanthes scabra]|uniref:Uncharacterized protein n=1 Tax=Stylosanthes scabra TaxID=79078 RepID=A0ABU6YXA1_9FABA|nr:hypothetical protein [Stylosanthes scabra]